MIVELVSKTIVADAVVTLTFRPSQAVSWEPGAHADFELAPGLTRSYSLIPNGQGLIEISVLREADSRGGSRFVHDDLAIGQRIEVSMKSSHFTLPAAACHHLIAGGIGITPLISIAERLRALGQRVVLHYLYQSPTQAAYWERSQDIADEVVCWDKSANRRFDVRAWAQELAAVDEVYACGPTRLLDAIQDACEDSLLPMDRLQIEWFSNADLDTQGDAFEVELASTGQIFTIGPDQTVLDALLDAGVDVPYACQEGVCGTCITPVTGGEVDHRDLFLGDDERAEMDQMAICCSRSNSPRLVLDL